MCSVFEIVKLQATNLRNLKNDIFEFKPGVNCIVGKNGQGKTNILEAIQLLFTQKTFRKKTSFPQLISIDSVKPEIIISGVIKNESTTKYLTTQLTSEKIKQFINNKPTRKRERFPSLFIGPFDFHRFNFEKEFRRGWFDTNIILINSEYEVSFNRYSKYIKQRNRLLSKQPYKFKDQIVSLDRTILKDIKKIEEARRHFLVDFKVFCVESYKSFFDEDYELSIEYTSHFQELSEDKVELKIQEALEKDLILGFTRYGPHKENFKVLVNELEIESYCSVGQQKAAYVSLIFAYISLFRYKHRSYPMVLIDDISGELDRERWQRFVNYFKEKSFQIIITTANKDFEEEIAKIENANLIYIDSGKIVQN